VAGQIANQLAPWCPAGRLRQRIENLATRRNGLATWLQTHTVFRHDVARRMAGLSPVPNGEVARFEALLDHESANWRSETPVGLSCLLDTRVYMTDQLLRDSDASSMAHSLELRVPFVDLALVAFSRSCADEFKLRSDGGTSNRYYGSGSKRVLIHALRDVLPLPISNRPKKGFALPFKHWMEGPAAALIEETCSHETVARRGLVDPALVETVRAQARAGVAGAAYPGLWTLMILELWSRAVLDKYRQGAGANLSLQV
jgi:asparagine synthetase B (glutamine-hydrolysing)